MCALTRLPPAGRPRATGHSDRPGGWRRSLSWGLPGWVVDGTELGTFQTILPKSVGRWWAGGGRQGLCGSLGPVTSRLGCVGGFVRNLVFKALLG